MPELAVIAEQLLAPVPGGTGRYTRELLRAMAATLPPGWTLTSVVSSTGDPELATIPGLDAPRVLRLPRRSLFIAWERGVPLWPGGDSVHAMTPLAPPSRRGRGLVVTVHDTVPWTHPETLTRRGVAWHRRSIARAAGSADGIVVPTEAVAADLARQVTVHGRTHVLGEGVSPAVVPAGANLVGPTDPAPRTAAEFTANDLPTRYVLAIGTIEPRKGFEDLVRAVAETDMSLIIAGAQGWGAVDLPVVAAECGLPMDRLRLLGAIDDAELATVLRGASVLAQPSLAEGFGLPVLEGMAAGVPVVHSDDPALIEVAGGAGITVPRANPALLAGALQEAANRRDELIAKGKRRAEGFTWEGVARAVWRIHQELIESSS